MPRTGIDDFNTNYTTRFEQWRKVRDCIEGEDKIKLGGQTYLPMPTGQNPTQYQAYKLRSSFYSIAERTLRGLTGLVFRNDPLVKVPDVLNPLILNATNDEYPFAVLLEEVVRELLSLGRYGILLDYPGEVSSTTLPHFVSYFAEEILNWQQEMVGGKQVLVRVVLRDSLNTTFGTDKTIFFELLLTKGVYTVKKWELGTTAGATPALVSTFTPVVNGKPLNRIPFFFLNPYDMRPDPEKPPFLDLCNMNLAHYRNSADYEHALFLTAQPTPWIAGALSEKERPTSIGAGTIWYLPEGTTVGMLEFTGTGIEAQRMAMQDKEDRMSVLGARMIKDNTRVQEKAETAKLRTRGETSLLMDVISTAEQGMSAALRMAAEWMGSDPGLVKVKLNRDFVDAELDANKIMAIVKSWQTGAISRHTMHENLQKGEIMPVDRSVEDEVDLIDAEGVVPIPGDETFEDPPGEEPSTALTGETLGHTHKIDPTKNHGNTSISAGHIHSYKLGEENTGPGGEDDHTHTMPKIRKRKAKPAQAAPGPSARGREQGQGIGLSIAPTVET